MMVGLKFYLLTSKLIHSSYVAVSLNINKSNAAKGLISEKENLPDVAAGASSWITFFYVFKNQF
jgi:hypothetical protein